jgi:hypothetical protein
MAQKITKTELVNLIKEEVKKAIKVKSLQEQKSRIEKQIKMLNENKTGIYNKAGEYMGYDTHDERDDYDTYDDRMDDYYPEEEDEGTINHQIKATEAYKKIEFLDFNEKIDIFNNKNEIFNDIYPSLMSYHKYLSKKYNENVPINKLKEIFLLNDKTKGQFLHILIILNSTKNPELLLKVIDEKYYDEFIKYNFDEYINYRNKITNELAKLIIKLLDKNISLNISSYNLKSLKIKALKE